MNRTQMNRIFLGLLLINITTFSFSLGSKEQTLESYNFFALGTTCTVNIYGGTEEQFAGIEELITGIESRMSVKIKDSEINKVNVSAGVKPVEVSPDVYRVISAGVRFSEISSGAFDISVGPLVNLWAIGNGGSDVPAEKDIAEALKMIDYTKIELLPTDRILGDRIYLPEKGMAL
ncbi:MAG: FAD:protein FMN transferase, partial [Spirochaetales bacterium]|nr:FAD:protein FMN transferase [Spirochaetales bacterium]